MPRAPRPAPRVNKPQQSPPVHSYAVDRVHVGTTFRAIRLELGLRQADVAARARVCQQTVSKVERGKFGGLSTDALFAVADAIEADLLLAVRWRGPKLARLLDRRHAQMQDRVVRLLSRPGWEVRVEESFNHFGDRGSVDVLAWRGDLQALLIVEVKTELVDLQETVRTLDMKTRVVPTVLRRARGWQSKLVASVLVLPEAHVHRRAVAQHAALLASALPARTWAIRRWLDNPNGSLRGIWFLSNTRLGSVVGKDPPTRRVSKRRKSVRGAIAPADSHR